MKPHLMQNVAPLDVKRFIICSKKMQSLLQNARQWPLLYAYQVGESHNTGLAGDAVVARGL